MKIMVVGGGGREHAIIKKLKENKEIEKIYALPGNGGMKDDAECVAIGAKDIDAIVDFAKNNAIDTANVGVIGIAADQKVGKGGNGKHRGVAVYQNGFVENTRGILRIRGKWQAV